MLDQYKYRFDKISELCGCGSCQDWSDYDLGVWHATCVVDHLNNYVKVLRGDIDMEENGWVFCKQMAYNARLSPPPLQFYDHIVKSHFRKGGALKHFYHVASVHYGHKMAVEMLGRILAFCSFFPIGNRHNDCFEAARAASILSRFELSFLCCICDTFEPPSSFVSVVMSGVIQDYTDYVNYFLTYGLSNNYSEGEFSSLFVTFLEHATTGLSDHLKNAVRSVRANALRAFSGAKTLFPFTYGELSYIAVATVWMEKYDLKLAFDPYMDAMVVRYQKQFAETFLTIEDVLRDCKNVEDSIFSVISTTSLFSYGDDDVYYGDSLSDDALDHGSDESSDDENFSMYDLDVYEYMTETPNYDSCDEDLDDELIGCSNPLDILEVSTVLSALIPVECPGDLTVPLTMSNVVWAEFVECEGRVKLTDSFKGSTSADLARPDDLVCVVDDVTSSTLSSLLMASLPPSCSIVVLGNSPRWRGISLSEQSCAVFEYEDIYAYLNSAYDPQKYHVYFDVSLRNKEFYTNVTPKFPFQYGEMWTTSVVAESVRIDALTGLHWHLEAYAFLRAGTRDSFRVCAGSISGLNHVLHSWNFSRMLLPVLIQRYKGSRIATGCGPPNIDTLDEYTSSDEYPKDLLRYSYIHSCLMGYVPEHSSCDLVQVAGCWRCLRFVEPIPPGSRRYCKLCSSDSFFVGDTPGRVKSSEFGKSFTKIDTALFHYEDWMAMWLPDV